MRQKCCRSAAGNVSNARSVSRSDQIARSAKQRRCAFSQNHLKSGCSHHPQQCCRSAAGCLTNARSVSRSDQIAGSARRRRCAFSQNLLKLAIGLCRLLCERRLQLVWRTAPKRPPWIRTQKRCGSEENCLTNARPVSRRGQVAGSARRLRCASVFLKKRVKVLTLDLRRLPCKKQIGRDATRKRARPTVTTQ